MRGKLQMSISGLENGETSIEFNMDNESEKEFFFKMQDFLISKGLKLTIWPTVSDQQK
jgi:hypothetical protein